MLVCEFFLRGCSWLPFTLAPPFGNAGRTTTLCAPGWGLCPHLTSWNIKGCSELLGLWAGQAPSGSLCSRGSHPKNTHWKPMCLESWKCTGATKWEHYFEAFFSGPTETICTVVACEDKEVPRRVGCLSPQPMVALAAGLRGSVPELYTIPCFCVF